MLSEPLSVVADLAHALDELGIPYLVGGSLASSMYGTPRATQDVDMLTGIESRHVAALVPRLTETFFLDPHAIATAVEKGESFNLIHKQSVFKADLFLARNDPWLHEELARAVITELELDSGSVCLKFATPEDTLLSKLAWYREGGEISDRQWTDVLGILRVQGIGLDLAHLDRWAAHLGIEDLLELARKQALE